MKPALPLCLPVPERIILNSSGLTLNGKQIPDLLKMFVVSESGERRWSPSRRYRHTWSSDENEPEAYAELVG